MRIISAFIPPAILPVRDDLSKVEDEAVGDEEDSSRAAKPGERRSPRKEPRPGRITAIEEQQRDTNRVSVYIDDVFAMGLFMDVAVTLGLRVGQQITQERLAEITDQEMRRKALETAYGFLSYRARSEKEITDKLRRKGYEDEAVVAATLDRLRENNLVNDAEFAAQWTLHRTSGGKGRRVIAQELRQKGVDGETVAETLAETISEESEAETAYNIAVRKVGIRPVDRSREAQAKLSAFLQRRGFTWDTVRPILRRLYDAGAPDTDDSETDDAED